MTSFIDTNLNCIRQRSSHRPTSTMSQSMMINRAYSGSEEEELVPPPKPDASITTTMLHSSNIKVPPLSQYPRNSTAIDGVSDINQLSTKPSNSSSLLPLRLKSSSQSTDSDRGVPLQRANPLRQSLSSMLMKKSASSTFSASVASASNLPRATNSALRSSYRQSKHDSQLQLRHQSASMGDAPKLGNMTLKAL